MDGGGVGEAGEKGNIKDSDRGINFVNEKVLNKIYVISISFHENYVLCPTNQTSIWEDKCPQTPNICQILKRFQVLNIKFISVLFLLLLCI